MIEITQAQSKRMVKYEIFQGNLAVQVIQFKEDIAREFAEMAQEWFNNRGGYSADGQTRTVIAPDGKRYKLPAVLKFGLDYHFYNVVDFRNPKKGEYYLSGAKIEAYEAPNDLGIEFLIAEKTFPAKQAHTWVKREEG